MPTNPFDQFDNSTNPFNQFDAPAAKAGSTSTFKSGSAFEDTKNLIPDLPAIWETLKKEWANRHNTPMTVEDAKKMMADEHAAGSGIFDALGALPAMAVGGVAGLGSAAVNLDASKGLKTGGEVMNKLMPSTLMGNEADQKSNGYQTVMAPFTGLMDTMNAIPQGYGEMLNATGHTDAAGQLTDAGKLAIMAAMGIEGAHSAYKGIMSKKGGDLKIEDPREEPTLKANPFDQFDKQGQLDFGDTDNINARMEIQRLQKYLDDKHGEHSKLQAQTAQEAYDKAQAEHAAIMSDYNDMDSRQSGQDNLFNPLPVQKRPMGNPIDPGIPGREGDPQGQLWQQEQTAPTAPIPTDGQGEMFGAPPQPPLPQGTIPYNVGMDGLPQAGGHEPQNPLTMQGDLPQQPSMRPPFNYEGAIPFTDHDPIEGTSQGFLEQPPAGKAPWDGTMGRRDAAAAQATRDAAWDGHQNVGADKDAAFAKAEAEQERRKQSDMAKMEAQRELDFMNSVNNVEGGTSRNFFTDPNNREKVARPEDKEESTGREFFLNPENREKLPTPRDSVARGHFLDPINMDKVDLHDVTDDHGYAGEGLGDKSLMEPEHTQTMVDALRRGDVKGALQVIMNVHNNVAYRKLAEYLHGALDNINVKVHDEGILQIGDRQATGYFDPESRTVGLSKVGAVSPHTVLHELVHAMTSDFVNMRPNDMRVLGLKDLYNKLNDLGMQKEFPGITNVKEFLAEAFSNPEFQKYLQDHQIQSRSTWRRFVDNVKSLLGISSATRNDVTSALEHVMDLGKQVMDAKSEPQGVLKDAGVPGKLADLMVTRQPEKPNMVVKNENMRVVEGLGKIGKQFDFTPLKPEEIIKMAKQATDISKGALETIKANLDAGGRFASLRHGNNPVIKYTFAHIDQAVKNYENWIKQNITDAKTGIKAMLRGLSKEDFTAVHQQLMLDEGQIERTPQQMRELGWSDKMVDAAQRIRQVDKEILAKVNEARAQMNPPLPPIERRIGHLAGRFLGDFYHTVYSLKADGTRDKAVMMITGSTKWEAQRIADFYSKEHPEWEVSKQEYKGIRKGNNSDRFSGFMELMSFIAHKDKEVAKALDSLDKYNRNAATNYLNQLRHAKAKKAQPGGVIGSEGHKAWVDAQTNAEEGFKGHMAYLDTSAKWLEMQKAMGNISKVITDKDVAMQMPNAVKWSTAYTDHALHRNQGWMTDFAQSLLSEAGRVTGIGHSNITKGVNTMSTYEMRKWMGIGNIPFALKHMLLPLQKMPAMMAYMHTVGGLGPQRQMIAGLKSLSSYVNYLKKDAVVSAFEEQAFRYAHENNVFNVNLDNLSGRIQSGKARQMLGKISDIDFSAPEHAIRGNSFFFYAHLLHDAGMEPQSALSAAEHLTKFLYTDYAPHEAPRAAAKAGWLGQLAFQVTRYKMNEISQLGFFSREGLDGMTDADHSYMKKLTSNAPLMTHIASTLAFTGVVGMLGYNEADHLYSLFRKYVMGSPDNLMAALQRSNAPESVKYGLFSRIGIDPKIDESHLIPAPFPTTTSQIEGIGKAWDMARYHDAWHTKQFLLSQTPSTFRGLAENHMFTQPQETQGPHAGKSLYLNPNTGEGRVWRTPEQQTLRNYGFHSTAETNETNNNYAMSRIESDNRDLAEHAMTKAKGLVASGSATTEALQELAREYAKHVQAGQPEFTAELQSYIMKQHMSQREQMEYKAANDRGMANSLNIMQRNK